MADAPAGTKDLSQIVGGSSEITEQAQPRTRRKSKYDGPNEEFLQMLIMNLGISRNAAEKVSCSRVKYVLTKDDSFTRPLLQYAGKANA